MPYISGSQRWQSDPARQEHDRQSIHEQKSDSRAQGGTGLGLSLVKHILNRHHGRLLIESVPKNGAVFTACFPQTKTPTGH